MRKRIVGLLLIFSMVFSGVTSNVSHAGPGDSLPGRQDPLLQASQLPTRGYFTENKGQWDSEFYFLGNTDFGQIGFTAEGIYYHLISADTQAPIHPKEDPDFNPEDVLLEGHVVQISFDRPLPFPKGIGELSHRSNYFLGYRENTQITDVKSYSHLLFENVWEDIDLHYFFNPEGLKYEFHVRSGADLNTIRMHIEGADLEVASAGRLAIQTPLGCIFDDQLLVYAQESKLQMNASFVLEGNAMYFDVDLPTHFNETLVIDPLVYSTYVGGTGNDYGYNIVVDNDGYAYVTGYSSNNNFPRTPGSYSAHRGGMDAVVFKMNQTGTALVYSTYLGSTSTDYGYGIAVDNTGHAYVTGYTVNANFPTAGAAFNTFPGGNTVFLTKLNPDGNALIYSNLFGGSSTDRGYDLAVDQHGNAYVTGITASRHTAATPFPITVGAYQSVHRGGTYDIFVSKFDASGTTLLFSTYVGGTGNDYAYGIAVDSNPNNVYVTGSTSNNTFPRLGGLAHRGGTDAVVFKLNYTGTQLIYSSFLGGTSTDIAYSIALDNATREVYVAGYTSNNTFPATPGAYQTTWSGSSDAFVAKFNAFGTALIYATYIGGTGLDRAFSIAIDNYGCAYITGYSNNNTFPVTPDGYHQTHTASYDGFVTKLDPYGTQLQYSTFVPGNGIDQPYGIALDSDNDVYITGWTQSASLFPITPGAYQDTHRGGTYDSFVQKLHIPVYLDVYPPKNPAIDRYKGRIHLEFESANPGTHPIKHYEIYRGTVNGFAHAVVIATLEPTQLELWDQPIDDEMIYYYYLVTVDTMDNVSSPAAITTYPVQRPTAPGAFTAIPFWNRIELDWEPANEGDYPIVSYRIMRGTTANVMDAREIQILNVLVFEFEDFSVSMNTDYFYFIQAIDERGFTSAFWAVTMPVRLLAVFLRLSAELSKNQFQHGDDVFILLTVYNYGNSPATDTKVTMTLPHELKFRRADRYRSIVQTPTLIDFEINHVPRHSISTFQIDLQVDSKVVQEKSIRVFFDITCAEKSRDSAHSLLNLVPQRTGSPELYLGLYYVNAHFDPQTGSIYIPQNISLEIDMKLHGARMPYTLIIDWGDGTVDQMHDNRDNRKLLQHTFKSTGKKNIKITVIDHVKTTKEASIFIEVR